MNLSLSNEGNTDVMSKFKVSTELSCARRQVSQRLLQFDSVQHELSPWLRMSASNFWRLKHIVNWPVGKYLFKSRISLLGVWPIDLHNFKFNYVGKYGFSEHSKTLVSVEWKHQRFILGDKHKTKVIDIIEFRSRLGFLDVVLLPLYKAVFHHRHKQLKVMFK